MLSKHLYRTLIFAAALSLMIAAGCVAQSGDFTNIAGNTGFATVTVQTSQGPVTFTMPRQHYSFNAIGETYYVSLAGSDSNDGSFYAPFGSIEKGLSVLQPGDLLYIRGGDYYTPFTVYRSGLPGRAITISSYPGETVRILQPAGWQRANLHSATVTLKDAQYVWLYGLDIQGCRGRSDAPRADTYGQNALTLCSGSGEGVKILNCTLSKALHCGIKEMGHGGREILIEGNVIFDNGVYVNNDHGIYIPGNDVVIRGNAIFRNVGFGVHLYSKPKRAQVYNNVIFEQQRDGIMQAGSGGLFAHNVAVRNRYGLKLFRDGCIGNTFANNIFIYNKDGQVGLDNAGGRTPWPSSNLIDYSAVYPMRRWLLPTSVSSWAGKSMILKDPLVMGYQWNDLRLSATSPARKKAFPLKMNGAYSWPDPGLFPATNYTEPAWW